MRRAVPHGAGCEYPEYPTGVTASVLSTHSAVEYRRLALGWAPPRALRGVGCAGRWRWRARGYLRHRLQPRERRQLDPREHSGARALPKTLLSTRAPRLPSGGSAPLMHRARRGLRVPGVPCRRDRLGAEYSQRSGVPPADPLGGRRREPCAAWGVQAKNNGGLVGIFGLSIGSSTTGHVSVVNSTLANITVRAHCRVPS
jgi:hypothetical protein